MKSFQVVLNPRAQFELQAAIDYYNNQLLGLGEKFILDFEKHLNILSLSPYFEILYKDYRGLTLEKFPYYQVLYYIDEKERIIYVDAVFHTAQNPNKKPK
jgi:toxin ParE1/3/4